MKTEVGALYCRAMPSSKTLLGVLVVAVVAATGSAAAQSMSTASTTTYTATLLGGLGGSIDENESGYDNTAVQLGFSVVTRRSSRFSFRAGNLGSFDRLVNLADADLTYVSVAGEYLFGEAGFVSGFFAGIGVYRLEGTRIIGGPPSNPTLGDGVSTTTVGVNGGFNGEFDITRNFVVVLEIGLHGITKGDAQFFANGLIGVGYKF